ncbi:MAG: P27 family phage terminase small subunit [Eubacterium sp.]
MSNLKKMKENVKESLVKQLVEKGADIECFIDLIEDYMGLWEVKNKLKDDIEIRGVMYEDYSSVGVKMQKNNPSVKELVGVNRQMLLILKELGINTAGCASGADDGNGLM